MRLLANGRCRSLLLFVIIIAASCVEEYNPFLEHTAKDVLVVDSYLNASTNSVHVFLSYAFDAAQDTISRAETGATVLLENENGSSQELSEIAPGKYVASGIDVDMDAQYRIHFFTGSDNEYASEFVPVMRAPLLDSVTWQYHAPEPGTHGINIMVNSIGVSGDGLYFLWDYEETWEYTASFFSEYKYVNRRPEYRAFDERMYVCYRTDPSSKILISTTEILARDVIRDHPILWIPGESDKLAKKYSILVRQRIITKEAYEFWSKVKRTTEDLGGLFDPPLTQVAGNIKNLTNGKATVVGFFGGGQLSEKRISIQFGELPEDLLRIRHLPLCESESLFHVPLSEIGKLNDTQIIISANYVGGILRGYFVSSPACSDCRLHGGVLAPPAFW
jgi:hypothetical protein